MSDIISVIVEAPIILSATQNGATVNTGLVNGYYLFPDSGTGRYFRIGVRANQLMQDKELTATGFAGVEGTDWENVTGVL